MPSKILLFLIAQALSEAGTALSGGGLAYLLYAKTGGTSELGLVQSAPILPLLLFGAFIGAYADRTEAKTLLLRVNILLAALVALFPTALAIPSPYYLYGLIGLFVAKQILSQAFVAAYKRSFRAMVPPRQLDFASSFESVASRLAVAGGMAAGPILASRLGWAVFWADAGTYLLAFVLVAGLNYRAPAAPTGDRAQADSPRTPIGQLFADVGEGLAYIARNAPYAALLVAYCSGFIMWATFEVAGIALMKHVSIAAEAYGTYSAAASLAEFGTAAGLLALRVRYTPGRAFAAGQVLAGATVMTGLLGALSGHVPSGPIATVAFILRAVTGVASNVLGVMAANILTVRVPAQIQGRLGGAVGVVSMVVFATAKLISGLMADAVNAPATFVTLGLLALMATFLAWRTHFQVWARTAKHTLLWLCWQRARTARH